jgi:hypothetical protein
MKPTGEITAIIAKNGIIAFLGTFSDNKTIRAIIKTGIVCVATFQEPGIVPNVKKIMNFVRGSNLCNQDFVSTKS